MKGAEGFFEETAKGVRVRAGWRPLRIEKKKKEKTRALEM